MEITGRVLGVLLTGEVCVIVAESVLGLAHPAGGHLSFATLSPGALGSAGFGTFGVLAVVAVLGFVGFEQAPVLGEEARHPRRTIPAATYTALGMIAVVYAGASWAMAAHTGTSHVVAAAAAQGPGLLFGLSGNAALGQIAPGAVCDLAVRRGAGVPQRLLALRVRAGPGERAARGAGPDRGQQHPQGRVPGAKRDRPGGHRLPAR